MPKINIKILSEDNLIYFKKNIDRINDLIMKNENNNWVYEEFRQPIFQTKTYQIEDFALEENKGSKDKEIDFDNSIKLYENLCILPKYILSDERFWLWLHLEKFYKQVRSMTEFSGDATIKNTWLHTASNRRGLLLFGILSRNYFRVVLTVDEKLKDKYELTKWVVENRQRYRELTIRNYSSIDHIVRGAIKGERKAVLENHQLDKGKYYAEIGKFISSLGSVKLLDAISEEDLEEFVYNELVRMAKRDGL